MKPSLVQQVKSKAIELGAGLVGLCPSSTLFAHQETMEAILPGHRSVVCLIVPHSRTALQSKDIRVKQYDTLYTYRQVERISHSLARYLEGAGYPTVAVPAFLPIDMSEEKKGMVGDIDWRRATVECGLAAWGRSSLALTPQWGPRVRIGGLLTTAILDYDQTRLESPCGGCQHCIEACPAQALLGDGKVNKKLCGDHIFAFGLRAFTRFLRDLIAPGDEEEKKKLIYSYRVRELWQTFQTGNYYYCWECQTVCPVGDTITI